MPVSKPHTSNDDPAEPLTVRLSASAVRALRAQAAADRIDPDELAAELLEGLLTERDRRLRVAELRRLKADLMADSYKRIAETGLSDDEMLAEIEEALREVRAETQLHSRSDR